MLVPKVLLEYGDKLGEEKTIDSLIANWDLLKIPSKNADYVGCFLPCNAEHHAGPNAPKYIRDQASHPKTSHAYTVMVTSKKHQLKQAVVSTRPPKVLSLEALSTSASNPKQLTFLGKSTQKQCYMKINNFLSTINGRLCETNASTGKGFLFVCQRWKQTKEATKCVEEVLGQSCFGVSQRMPIDSNYDFYCWEHISS